MHFLDTNEYGSHTGTATLRLSRATTIPWLVPHQETRSANQRAGRRVLGGHVTGSTNEGTARGVGGHCGPLHRQQANRPLLRLEVTSPSGAGVKSSRAETRDERERGVWICASQ